MKQKVTEKNILGFTLIEILVVVAIIGVLAGLSAIGLSGSFEASRDAQRKSDLKQYQAALEQYANNHNTFYSSRIFNQGVAAATTLCTDIGLSGCPADPKTTGWDIYRYQSDGNGSGNADATRNLLWAKLENVKECGASATDCYYIVCSNGKTGVVTSVSSITNGTCPLP